MRRLWISLTLLGLMLAGAYGTIALENGRADEIEDCVPATLRRFAQMQGEDQPYASWVAACQAGVTGVKWERIAIAWKALVKQNDLVCVYRPTIEPQDTGKFVDQLRLISDSNGYKGGEDLMEKKPYVWVGLYKGPLATVDSTLMTIKYLHLCLSVLIGVSILLIGGLYWLPIKMRWVMMYVGLSVGLGCYMGHIKHLIEVRVIKAPVTMAHCAIITFHGDTVTMSHSQLDHDGHWYTEEFPIKDFFLETFALMDAHKKP